MVQSPNVYFFVIYFSEPINCVDLKHCSSVTPDQCSAFSTLRTICPLKCDVEQCRPRKCEDTPECPKMSQNVPKNGVVPSLCGLLGNEDKYKCNKTCGLCEDVNIQGEFGCVVLVNTKH